MPPAVGIAETNSAIVKAIIRINIEMTGQPIDMATGPPLFQACPNVVKQPDRTEMIENEIAKLEKPDQRRSNSCLYPSDSKSLASASC